MRMLSALLVLLAATAPAWSASIPTIVLDGEDPDRPQLLVYDALYCDEIISNECPLVSLSCDGQGSLSVSYDDVDDVTLAEWLEPEGDMTLSIEGITAGDSFYPHEMLMNDMNGTWSVGFLAQGASNPLRIMDGAKALIFDSIGGHFIVSLHGDNMARLEQFVSACGDRD